jgi:hypothetical protein
MPHVLVINLLTLKNVSYFNKFSALSRKNEGQTRTYYDIILQNNQGLRYYDLIG